MDIVEKLPDNLKRYVFEYNPCHRKTLKIVHKELLARFCKCNSWRCNSTIDTMRQPYYQGKVGENNYMSIFCSWTCLYDEKTYQSRDLFFNIASTADAYMALMTP